MELQWPRASAVGLRHAATLLKLDPLPQGFAVCSLRPPPDEGHRAAVTTCVWVEPGGFQMRISRARALVTLACIVLLAAPELTWAIVNEAAIPSSSRVNDIALSNGLLLRARESAGLQWLDVSDPNHPTQVGTTLAGETVGQVAAHGDLVFARVGAGVSIIDASNAALPVVLSTFTGTSLSYGDGLAASGARAVALRFTGHVVAYDLSDPTNPVELGSLFISGGFGDAEVRGSLAFVTYSESGLHVIDLDDPSGPVEIGALPYSLANSRVEVRAFGDHLMVAHGLRLSIVDVASPASPVEVGSLVLPSMPTDIEIVGDLAFITANFHAAMTSVMVVDVSEPTLPVLLGSMATPRYCGHGVAVTGVRVHVGCLDEGSLVVDGSVSSGPALVAESALPDGGWDIELRGHLAYVATSSTGLRIFDMSDPLSPVDLGGFSGTWNLADIDVEGSHAYVPDRIAGLRIVDVSNPSAPTQVGQIGGIGQPHGVEVVEHIAYVAAWKSGGLQIVDVSDPSAPTLLGAIDTPDHAYDVEIDGSTAFVADNQAGVRVIDVSDPAQPIEISALDTFSDAYRVRVRDGVAYVAARFAGLVTYDVSTPGSPVFLGQTRFADAAHDVELTGDYAIVSTTDAGVRIVDISDPARLEERVGYSANRRIRSARLFGPYVLAVSSDDDTLELIDFGPRVFGSANVPGLQGSMLMTLAMLLGVAAWLRHR